MITYFVWDEAFVVVVVVDGFVVVVAEDGAVVDPGINPVVVVVDTVVGLVVAEDAVVSGLVVTGAVSLPSDEITQPVFLAVYCILYHTLPFLSLLEPR